MTTLTRAPVAEAPTAETISEARRRADRARGTRRNGEPPERADQRGPASRPLVRYSIGSIDVTPPEASAPPETAPPTSAPPTSAPPASAPPAEAGQQPAPSPAPEVGASAEQAAAREAETSAARAALDSAQSSAGLMSAFAEAPPTVKAQVAGALGTRLGDAMSNETQELQQNTPPVGVEMQPNNPQPRAEIPAPAQTEVNLEPAAVNAAPDAEAIVGEPVVTQGSFDANAGVVGQLRQSFQPESGAEDLDRALNSIQTSDPSIVPSPGTPPPVPQTGDTDPQRFQNQVEEGSRQARATLVEQQQAAAALPGSERIQLPAVHEEVPVGELAAPTAESAAPPEGAQQYLQMNVTPDVQAAFDDVAGPQMQQSMADSQQQIQQATQERDQQHQAEVERAQRESTEAQQQAATDQRQQVATTRGQIEQQRQSTVEQQQSAVRDVEQQADERRETDHQQFDERARSDQEQIDNRYRQAETDATAEVRAGERRAEAERAKAEREAEDQSWWEAAVSFITDLFDALLSLIGTIFDAVRSAVNGILNAVRDFAVGLIQLAASALRGLIQAFGTFLKGLVSALLADIFPGLARALTNFIDQAVDAATRAVNAVAAGLTRAVNAIVEGLRAGINAALNVFQAVVNTALSLARAALTGDWSGFIMQLLEAACRIAGLDPEQIYAFIGRARETIEFIVNNPGTFLSNVLDALLGGFRRFADNFLTHLQAGIIGWLTGALGGAGITVPERFDLMGVISLVAQVLGLTWANLRLRIVRIVGERGMQVIEFVAGYVQTLIQGGWSALWERIQNDLSTLRDMVLEQIRNFLVVRVITAAVTRLATMFNPVGALVNILIAAYNFYTFIRDQLQRIMQIVSTVVEAITNIARGILEPAQAAIERFLAGLLPLALDLLARLIGLGNVGEQVRAILQRVQDTIWGAIDRVINSVVGMFRGGGAAGGPGPAVAGAGAGTGGEIGERITIPTEQGSHTLYIVRSGQGAEEMVATAPMTVQARIADWRTRLPDLSDTPRQGQSQSDRVRGAGLLTSAEAELAQLDPLADALAQQGAVAPRPGAGAPPPATPATPAAPAAAGGASNEQQVRVTREEQQLATVLGQLFQLFGDRLPSGGALAQRFAGNVASAHREVQGGVQESIRALERDIPAGQSGDQLYSDWQSVRTAIESSHNFRRGARGGAAFREFIRRPLVEVTTPLAGVFPATATQDIAVAGLQEAIHRAPAPVPPATALPSNFNPATFVQGQKALIHEQHPPYDRSVLSIRAVIWDARAETAAKRTVGEELYRRASDPSSRPAATNEEKIAKYQAMYQAASVPAPPAPTGTITDRQTDDYRRAMRTAIAARYARAPLTLTDLNSFLDRNDLFEGGYNRIRGEIFESWIAAVIPNVADNRPVFKLANGRQVQADRIRGSELVEAKAIVEPRPPSAEEITQMQGYATIIREYRPGTNGNGVTGVLVDRNEVHVGNAPQITGVLYIFNRGSVAQAWLTALRGNLPGLHSIQVGDAPFDPNRTYND